MWKKKVILRIQLKLRYGEKLSSSHQMFLKAEVHGDSTASWLVTQELISVKENFMWVQEKAERQP